MNLNAFGHEKLIPYHPECRRTKLVSPTAIAQADEACGLLGRRRVQALDSPSAKLEAMLVATAASGPP